MKHFFQIEIDLCQDFQPNEEEKGKDIHVTFNFSNDEMVIWLYFDKMWDKECSLKFLNKVVSRKK